jgi:hypothetical protein
MKRITLITSIMLVATPGAFAKSDEEIIETVRTSAAEIFLEQISITVTESFLNSGLSPSDKERLMLQLANDSADCLADAVVEYAALYDVPISDLVSSEGTIHFDGDSGSEFEQLLNPCVLIAWQTAGVSRE